MKSAQLYQEQFRLLCQQQKQIIEDMAQVLAEAILDGYRTDEIANPPKASAQAPVFDL